MQRANETERVGGCTAFAAAKGILLGIVLAVSVCTAAPTPAPEPNIAHDAVLMQPLWHAAPAAPSLSSAQTSSLEVPLHHFDLPCHTCHDSTDQSEVSWSVGTRINKGCTAGCHENDPMLNHPLGVRIPAGVQGSADGSSRITCITCHVPVKGASTTDQGRAPGVLMPPDSDICASCHLHMNSAGSRQAHWRFSTKAHLGRINPLGGSPATIPAPSGRIDDESMACLNCHDDVTVTVPGENETRQEQVARWSRMQDHPIGMDYQAIAGRQMVFFNYPTPTSNHVRLFDNRVGCGSCHSLYASNSSNYTIAERGDLCRKCHIR